MSPFVCAIFLLHISLLSTAANLTVVYEWPGGLEYEWPTFQPVDIEPRYMAVYGSRIFLSLEYKINRVPPATLVSLPTSSESSASPKITPFPSWDMHGIGNCNKIEYASGLDVDTVGRLWVLDSGSSQCKSKIWIIDLMNNNEINHIPSFSSDGSMHDLVLDETANETFAYISLWGEEYIVVYCLERNEFWIVLTPDVKVFSIALSPKKDQEPRQLYLGKRNSTELYSISVAVIHKVTGKAEPELVGKWTAKQSYRMLMDNHGTFYARHYNHQRYYYHTSKDQTNASYPYRTILCVQSIHNNILYAC
ncbi:protein yellow-like [Cloeon dipterum]|uniref:protein yellow-like n=1 Tax=Cloeon dipterum TaxID=197152 RepID=UPI00321F6D35